MSVLQREHGLRAVRSGTQIDDHIEWVVVVVAGRFCPFFTVKTTHSI
jgi:hypothetical protein